jgi:adenosine deaminase
VRATTLAELARERGLAECSRTEQWRRRTLAECFEIFRTIHAAVDRIAALRRVVAEATADFAADGVRYVEFRTTPRPLTATTAEEYLQTVLSAAREAIAGSQLDIDVGLVVSVDRGRPVADAMEAVSLARTLSAQPWAGRAGVVGVELSGNPHAGSFASLRPALDFARAQAGLPVSLHMAERPDKAEAAAMLDWGP